MDKAIGVIIPAAGAGNRLGGTAKPLVEIGGRPIITRILSLFSELRGVRRICLAVPEAMIVRYEEIVRSMGLGYLVETVPGGQQRADSVRNAYERLGNLIEEEDLVCIHDAARPLLVKSDLDMVIGAGRQYGAALLALRVKDTLKSVDDENFCVATVDRAGIFGAQTPQVMTSKFLAQAYAEVKDISNVTDEITLMEMIGVRTFVVEPRHLNLKLTTPEDLELIRKLIS
jgi:2-C-methyl-D-erythritol 4-phosphate cytidylyltransferase